MPGERRPSLRAVFGKSASPERWQRWLPAIPAAPRLGLAPSMAEGLAGGDSDSSGGGTLCPARNSPLLPLISLQCPLALLSHRRWLHGPLWIWLCPDGCGVPKGGSGCRWSLAVPSGGPASVRPLQLCGTLEEQLPAMVVWLYPVQVTLLPPRCPRSPLSLPWLRGRALLPVPPTHTQGCASPFSSSSSSHHCSGRGSSSGTWAVLVAHGLSPILSCIQRGWEREGRARQCFPLTKCCLLK